LSKKSNDNNNNNKSKINNKMREKYKIWFLLKN
jgi:hypothetical protein